MVSPRRPPHAEVARDGVAIRRYPEFRDGPGRHSLFLAASYPFTKRFFAIPQAYLGIAFGFGIPMAYAAVQHGVPVEAWILLAANVFWAIAYDTEYAMVDRDDDRRIGIKTSAILFGRYDVMLTMLCHAIFLTGMAVIGYRANLGIAYIGGLAAAATLAAAQYFMIRDRSRDGCFRAFLNNNWVGAVIFAGIVLDFIWGARMPWPWQT